VRFAWDPEKARSNQAKHGITFDDAKPLFTSGVDYLEIYDAEHSGDEDRFLAIGSIERGVICVAFTEEDEDHIRIISARSATRRERQLLSRHIGKAGS